MSTPVVSARHFAGTPTVGALFLPGFYPRLHTCTASVVRSASGSVIMTAAHCVHGSGKGYVFAPGYRDGRTPFGVWRVTAAYGSRGWVRAHRPQQDWAFLLVRPREVGGRRQVVEQVTGANSLGSAPRVGTTVEVPAYPIAVAGRAITCQASVYRHAGYPAFDCGGYVGGTSGAPWLVGTRRGRAVVGLVAGLHQGGCTPGTSYSPQLGPAARRALVRADRRAPPDVFPGALPDGCSASPNRP
ncbi:MAG TPA: serine protease [Mycobacteriales bacterium]|nr:serine protease [Mycobacteriales bacterium]